MPDGSLSGSLAGTPLLGSSLAYMVYKVSFDKRLLNDYSVLSCLASSLLDITEGIETEEGNTYCLPSLCMGPELTLDSLFSPRKTIPARGDKKCL